MDPQPRNLAQLATALESAWLNIPVNTFRNPIDSLPACLAVVRSAKGGYSGFSQDKQTNNDENSKNGDVSNAEECVLSLQKSLTQLEEKSGNISGINMEVYLTADDDPMVFAKVTEEDILYEMGNDDEEDGDDDTDPSQSLLTSQEALQSVQSLHAFFSSTNDDHFCSLDSMETLLVDLTVKK
ncbi:hypothetical protein AVEN_267936-1 [Araneus ventricosus]|uniref:Uncharacterized protein n=1 Tax=Araneus ventricosus TaxID=182803 RepID=A0A4Y2S9B1_ARAVE|nr:hypothetical protein AVEN_267936-1 [Araneus ventricosus]